MTRSAVLQAISVARTEAATTPDFFYDAVVVERTLLFFQELLLKLSKRTYFMHPEFLPALEDGYTGLASEFSDDDTLTLVDLLESCEGLVSRVVYNNGCSAACFSGISAPTYQYTIGYGVGLCVAILESDMAPLLPRAVNLRLAPVLLHLFRALRGVAVPERLAAHLTA